MAGAPCADSSECVVLAYADRAALIAVASDGAGGAQKAEVGSALACRLFLDEIRLLFQTGGSPTDITREFVEHLVMKFQSEAATCADDEGISVHEYACTFLAAVVGEDSAVVVQVGDGATVARPADDVDQFCLVFWPQHGEYANETAFLTDASALDSLEYRLIQHEIDEIAIFTDGLERMVLDFEKKTAHMPFFESMLRPLRQESAGHLEDLSHSLAVFLDSPKVNDHTHDDKTLILASRLS